MNQRPSQKSPKTAARKPAKAEAVHEPPRARSPKAAPPSAEPPQASAEPSPRVAASLQVPPEVIAQRAYLRFQARGFQHGHDQEDWFQAEQELLREFG